MSHTAGMPTLGLRRWVPRVAAAAVLLVVGVFVLVSQRAVAPRASAPLQARLELAAGAVLASGGEAGGDLRPAVSGAALPEGARLSAGKGARALVRLSSGASAFLRDQTQVALRGDGLDLLEGEAWVDAPATEGRPGSYRLGGVTVSAADAGLNLVRHTDDVTVYVARGLAVVDAPGGRVEVQAGEEARVSGPAAPQVKPVTFWADWTGGMADHRAAGALAGSGAGTIYGVDTGGPAGSPARTLEVARQAVRAVVRDGLAETQVDQTFFNPHARNVEGWYWFTVPAGASVTGFALETNGVLVEGELIERQLAAAHYAAAISTGHQPALLEWVNSRTFRARIYPVPAGGSRRVVLRYLELMPSTDGRLRYVYPLQGAEGVRVGEFSLTVDLGEAGTRMAIATLAEARVEDNGRRVTMRRSGFKPLSDFQLEARVLAPVPPVRVSRFAPGGESADYVMARYVPDVRWDDVGALPGEVVLVVDTSAGGDEGSRQLRTAAAEAVLRALSEEDRFALVRLDVAATVLYPPTGLAPAKPAEISAALERLADTPPGGATDLAALFDVALGRLHGAEQPAVVYVGDGWATSGEMGGEQLAGRLSRALSTSRARLFTLAAGGEANLPLLSALARAGGGVSLALDSPEETTDRALRLAAAIKTPTITDLELDLGAGLDETFVSAHGKVSRGQEVVLLARTHHGVPPVVTVKGRLAGKPFTRQHPVVTESSVASSLVPRLWAAESIRRLLGTVADPEEVRGKVIKVGVEYGLVTPFTSFIALESEAAYRQQGIPRRSTPLRGVRLSSLTPHDEWRTLVEMGPLVGEAVGLGCARMSDPAPMVQSKSRAEETAAPAAAFQDKMEAVAAGERASLDDGEAQARPPSPTLAPRSLAAREARRDDSRVKDGPSPTKPDGPPGPAVRACSDAARRPLSDRATLWERRLRAATSPRELQEVYLTARASCEIPDWRAESRFHQVLERHLQTEEAMVHLLSSLRGMPEAQRYLARLLMRRAVDPQVVLAILQALASPGLDWARVDVELAAIPNVEGRIQRLREQLARVPDDAQGTVRLCRLLAQADHAAEALGLARRLKERGLLNPLLVRELGDLLARQGQDEEALRTYSEIVEFDPRSTASRRLLGDIYLAHGWYGPAYRQYKTLTELEPAQWAGWLRLASAAAGSGRTDEALRIERRVAEAEGSPGPRDPRRWARAWSGARLARLLVNPPQDQGDAQALAEGLKRRLKELQLFQGPSTMAVVTWEDLSVDLEVKPGGAVAVADAVDAAEVGLSALWLPAGAGGAAPLVANVRSGVRAGPVTLTRHDVAWDGKTFTVTTRDVVLKPESTSVSL
jgi:tetratricopeptide (TPR) repeat protein/Mg-chelatase subunit ChlD